MTRVRSTILVSLLVILFYVIESHCMFSYSLVHYLQFNKLFRFNIFFRFFLGYLGLLIYFILLLGF